MNQAVPDCLVEEYEDLIPGLRCADPGDRHVFAAAIKGRCSAIVTFNTKDFLKDELIRFDLEVQHPDEFLFHQIGLDRAVFLTAVRTCRLRLRKQPLNPADYLDSLLRQQLPTTVNELQKYSSIL